MTKMNKPPLRKPAVDLQELDKFASGGVSQDERPRDSVKPETTVMKALYPWEEPSIRKDVVKGMGVPLSEPYILKLRFIAENTRFSQRKFCQVRLEEAIDKEIAAILENPGRRD